MQKPTLKVMPKPHLTIAERWCNSFLVNYPVSYRYNGGIIIDNKWYSGFSVPPPHVPDGFQLVNIGVGLQMNACPPYATTYLKPLNGKKVSKSELKKALAEVVC